MAVDNGGEHGIQIGVRFDADELTGLDERGDDRPVLGARWGYRNRRNECPAIARASGAGFFTKVVGGRPTACREARSISQVPD